MFIKNNKHKIVYIKEMPTKLEGMMTKVWGPTGWIFLHSVTFGYPEKIDNKIKDHRSRKKDMKLFMTSLAGVLPCNLCRDSFKIYIRHFSRDLGNKAIQRTINYFRLLSYCFCWD